MENFRKLPKSDENIPCVILIGMAGAGKTTIGNRLAKKLGWAFIDTDFLIESLYAAPLQSIVDSMTREQFLDIESSMICEIRAHRCIIATGGSVVYRPAAMAHLANLGLITHLSADVEKIKERIAINPQRGMVFGPGQTIETLFNERDLLYKKYSVLSCDTARGTPDECAGRIIAILKERGILADNI